jgi:hypothetical protein
MAAAGMTWILLPVLRKYYEPVPPDPEFYLKLNRVTPELQKLAESALDRAAMDVRNELTPKVESALAAVFKAIDR